MAKKLFLTVLVVLGSSIIPLNNETQAIFPGSSPSDATAVRPHRHRSPYRILNTRYVSRSTVRNISTVQNGVRIHILQNGADNADIENFDLAFDSGNEYRSGNVYGIDFTRFPLYLKVTYRTWNTFHAVQNDVVYELVIYRPGTWDVTIHN